LDKIRRTDGSSPDLKKVFGLCFCALKWWAQLKLENISNSKKKYNEGLIPPLNL
jgi:hypothetical protein